MTIDNSPAARAKRLAAIRAAAPFDAELQREDRNRQVLFTEALRTAKTKPERARVIAAFHDGSPTPPSLRIASRESEWLAGGGHGFMHDEVRTAAPFAESVNVQGGYFVPSAFNGEIIRQLKECAGFLAAFETWFSGNGAAAVRPLSTPMPVAGSQSEQTSTPVQITNGPNLVVALQNWGQTPPYSGYWTVSNQLLQDAFRNAAPGSTDGVSTFDELVAGFLAESLGRVVAPVATTALYAAINAVGANSGQNGGFINLTAATPINYITGTASTELIQNTINLDTAALMIAALDVAYLPGAKFYFNSQQWANLIRQVDSSKHLQIDPGFDHELYGYPVVITSQTSAAVASTVGGPVFGDLSKAMTLRVAEQYVLRSTERFADYLQTFFMGYLRADFQPRDNRAMVGVKYAAT